VTNIQNVSITRTAKLRQALSTLDQAGLGILLLTDESGLFERTVTDGDLRRLVLAGAQLEDSIASLPVIRSQVINTRASRREALDVMNRHAINHLPGGG
jgi:CBS domain-containing protein